MCRVLDQVLHFDRTRFDFENSISAINDFSFACHEHSIAIGEEALSWYFEHRNEAEEPERNRGTYGWNGRRGWSDKCAGRLLSVTGSASMRKMLRPTPVYTVLSANFRPAS